MTDVYVQLGSTTKTSVSEDYNEHIFSGEYAKNLPSKYCDGNHFREDQAKNTLSENYDEHNKYCDENRF